jgi:uncharacterized membrane protein YgdD (TMEM256/DUF423 family)
MMRVVSTEATGGSGMGPWLAAGSINGFMAIAMGAFAAHGLRKALDPAAIAWVETGSRYQMAHALALLAVALLIGGDKDVSRRLLQGTGLAFLAGVVLFAGGLYSLALTGIGAFAWCTPVGGILLLAGWAALAWYGILRWRAARRR